MVQTMIKLMSLPGNQQQLIDWLEKFQEVEVVSAKTIQVSEVNSNDIFCIPGGNNVGAFSFYKNTIMKLLEMDVKCIFICGAFQLLFSSSEELTENQGLCLFDFQVENLGFFKIGFEDIYSQDKKVKESVFFNHRYGICLNNNGRKSLHGTQYFTSDDMLVAIITKNIFGTQFHPELSHSSFDKVFKHWLTER